MNQFAQSNPIENSFWAETEDIRRMSDRRTNSTNGTNGMASTDITEPTMKKRFPFNVTTLARWLKTLTCFGLIQEAA